MRFAWMYTSKAKGNWKYKEIKINAIDSNDSKKNFFTCI
jgi:hypothetical protein